MKKLLTDSEMLSQSWEVFDKTGFTPRQLAEQKAELLEMLIKIEDWMTDQEYLNNKGFDMLDPIQGLIEKNGGKVK